MRIVERKGRKHCDRRWSKWTYLCGLAITMDSHQSESKSNIRRRRTGCLTCRARRVRCDERKPQCANCSRKDRACTWAKQGDKFRHLAYSLISAKPPRNENHFESSESRRLSNAEEIPGSQESSSVGLRWHGDRNIDGRSPTSVVVEAEILNSSQPDTTDRPYPSPVASTGSTGAVSVAELSCWQSEVLESLSYPSASEQLASSICRSQSARLKQIIDVEHASSIPPNLEPNAELFSDWQSLGASKLLVDALAGKREMDLLETYLQICAPWFDIVDSERSYARKDVARMMSCPPWRAAALAISAKHLELSQRAPPREPLSLHLYQLSVQLAIDSISGRFDCVGTTAGCVILAVYEMMTVTYHNWRRHLRGCTSIYSHNRWNGNSMGLIRASFWNYARIGRWSHHGGTFLTPR
jgi:hypothetical protein